jgi:chromosome segregation ATPase
LESREEVTLEDLIYQLDTKIKKLKEMKTKLDGLVKIVNEINEKEEVFRKYSSNLENLNKKMLLYYYESDVYYNKVQTIEQNLQNVKFEYEQEVSSLSEELENLEFNDGTLNKLSEKLKKFFGEESDNLNHLKRQQENILQESVRILKDRVTIVSRLISAIDKKIENLSKDELKGELEAIKSQIKNVSVNLPSKLEDFERIYEKSGEAFRGLYETTKSEIDLIKEKLRRFAIENRLIEANEVTVLEIIHTILYERNRESLEFNEMLEYLKERIPKTGEQELRDIIVNLSKKGFLTLTLAT